MPDYSAKFGKLSCCLLSEEWAIDGLIINNLRIPQVLQFYSNSQ